MVEVVAEILIGKFVQEFEGRGVVDFENLLDEGEATEAFGGFPHPIRGAGSRLVVVGQSQFTPIEQGKIIESHLHGVLRGFVVPETVGRRRMSSGPGRRSLDRVTEADAKKWRARSKWGVVMGSLVSVSGGEWLRVCEANPAAGSAGLEKGGVFWTGWLGERSGEAWEPEIRHMLPGAAGERAAVVERLLGVEERPMVRPHARHLVSDVPGTLSLLRAEPRLRLVLEPAVLLEPSMLGAVEDHVMRMVDALLPMAAGLVLSNVRVAESEWGPWCEPWREGVLAEAVLALVREQAERAGVAVVARG